jgi:leader peptidase (prepilin peptidase)/N-methyltransferase
VTTMIGDFWPCWALVLLLGLFAAPVLRLLVIRFAEGRPAGSGSDDCTGDAAGERHSLAALLPTASCARCGRRLGAPPLVLEAVALVAVATILATTAPWPILLAGLWWTACAVPLAFIDVRTHRLPDLLTYSAAGGVGAFFATQAALSGQGQILLRASVAAAVCSGVFLLAALTLGQRGIGLGDVKLVVSVAMLLSWWGWAAVFLAVFLAFLASGAVGAALLATRRATRTTHLPMGPFFVAATIAVVSLHAAVGSHSA